jgi:hypothetical protein
MAPPEPREDTVSRSGQRIRLVPPEEFSMTDIGSTGPDMDTTRVAYGNEPDPTGWTGWVVFAGFMMILVGLFQAIQGLVALFDDGFYLVGESGLVVDVNYNVWGTIHLLFGLVLVLSGLGVLAGNLAARTVGVILAGLSALVNMAFIGAYPVWSLIIITVDVLVIYSLIVHGKELHDSGR